MPRRAETIDFWVGNLPHWEVVDGRYFVTVHLRGAIPVAGQRLIRERVAEFERSDSSSVDARLRLHRQIFREMERWLDRAPRRDDLSRPEIAEMVVEAIRHRQQQGIWQMFQFVVMPSHVHLFFELTGGRLKETMEDFKRWTGGQAARLSQADRQRFWQTEWFDHWSRSDEEDQRIIRYIRENPLKAGLVKEGECWLWCGP